VLIAISVDTFVYLPPSPNAGRRRIEVMANSNHWHAATSESLHFHLPQAGSYDAAVVVAPRETISRRQANGGLANTYGARKISSGPASPLFLFTRNGMWVMDIALLVGFQKQILS
jgi:hypothetical protein